MPIWKQKKQRMKNVSYTSIVTRLWLWNALGDYALSVIAWCIQRPVEQNKTTAVEAARCVLLSLAAGAQAVTMDYVAAQYNVERTEHD